MPHSGTRQIVSATTTSAIGTLMKNTQRHDACCTNHPPSTGPIAAVIEVKPDHVPMARPRCSFGNETLISARLPGTSSAPPTPCRPRAAINIPMFGARPHHTDATANSVTPAASRASAVKVAQRSACQEKRGKHERVRFDDPLNVRYRRMQIGLQRRQRHVHDGAIDERHARTEDCHSQHPRTGGIRPTVGPA